MGKKLAFTVSLEVYPYDVRFSFGESDFEVNEFLKKHQITESCEFETDKAVGRCEMFGNGAGIIRMKKIPKTAEDYGTLQHEITHYVMFLLNEKLHIPHNLETTEAYGYLTGYITTKVYNKLW